MRRFGGMVPSEWAVTALPQFCLAKRLKHLGLGWGVQDILCRKLLRLGIRRVSNALRHLREIVGRLPQLNLGSQQDPIGARIPKRHPNTARIHNTSFSNPPVKLHVAMTADDHRCLEAVKEGHEVLFGRHSGEDLRTSPSAPISSRRVLGQRANTDS
jgi:hypothetical protein